MVDPVEGEMNVRRAKQLAALLRLQNPALRVTTWPIAQGLCYIKVDGPTTRGVLQLVLKTERDVATLLTGYSQQALF